MVIALLAFAGCVTAAVPQPISAGEAVTPETAKEACKQMNALPASELAKVSDELLVKYYCLLSGMAQEMQPAGSMGRLECLKAAQASGGELSARGLPTVGLCN